MENNNKFMADFMGYTQFPDNSYCMPDHQEYDMLLESFVNFYNPEDMKFDTSWNWLMKVVEKIEFEGYKVIIDLGSCHIKDRYSSEKYDSIYLCSSKIEAVYVSCVNFINHWNQNHKK